MVLRHQPKKDLAFIGKLLEAGRVVPVIDRRYSLGDVPTVLRYLGAGHAKGKLVMTVDHGDQSGYQ